MGTWWWQRPEEQEYLRFGYRWIAIGASFLILNYFLFVSPMSEIMTSSALLRAIIQMISPDIIAYNKDKMIVSYWYTYNYIIMFIISIFYMVFNFLFVFNNFHEMPRTKDMAENLSILICGIFLLGFSSFMVLMRPPFVNSRALLVFICHWIFLVSFFSS